MRKVRKAVIPAAGHGTRLLPATKAQPKEMLPVIDRPAIQYVVEEAAAAGLDDILIITSRNKQAIADHFDRLQDLEAVLEAKGKTAERDEVLALARLGALHYIRQGEQLGLGHAVLHARHHVGSEPFAVLLGDDVIDPDARLLERMLDAYRLHGRPVVALLPVAREEIHLYGAATASELSEEGVYEVSDMVEKPPTDEAPSTLAVIGRYVLTPEVFDALDATEPGRGGEIQLTDALRAVARKEPVVGVRCDGVRHDIGDKLGYLKATVMMAAERPDLGPDFVTWLREYVGGLERSR